MIEKPQYLFQVKKIYQSCLSLPDCTPNNPDANSHQDSQKHSSKRTTDIIFFIVIFLLSIKFCKYIISHKNRFVKNQIQIFSKNIFLYFSVLYHTISYLSRTKIKKFLNNLNGAKLPHLITLFLLHL